MKLRPRHIPRFLLAGAVAATLTVLLIRGRNPSFLDFHPRSPAEKALGQVIRQVDFRGVQFNQALHRLSQGAGVEIDGDASVRSTEAYFKNINVYDEHITLDEAMSQVLRSEGDPVFIFPEGGRIQIGFAGSAEDRMFIDELDLVDHSGPEFANLDLLAGGSAFDGRGFVASNRLFILQSASSHRRLRQLLDALDPRATPAARRSQLPLGTEVIDIIDGTLRPRDSRAASKALRSVIPVVNVPRQPLFEALGSLSAQAGISILQTAELSDESSEVELSAKGISLQAALKDLLHQAASDRLGMVPDRDTVWICRDVEPILIRIYDLRSASFATCTKTERSSRMAALLAAVPYERRYDGYASARFQGSMLVVSGTWAGLDVREESLLERLKSFDSNHAAAHP